jgi:diadenylate cyclase
VQIITDYLTRVAQYNWWVVGVELFFIGLVVYWVIEFLEGTRGERLFRGVIFVLLAGVLILNLIVEKYSFDRLEYLYKGFLIFLLIIAVAAFQPEIRRALIRIGQPRFLAGSSQQLARTAEEVIDGLVNLSENKIGAIIVIEKRVALGEFIETGVRLDSRVKSDLLKTIFYPGSPLHDMAVIIREDKIVAARVQLPLAEAESLRGIELGSRHRAAIGITSGSDATCLVVSEETGMISIAENGTLHRNVDEKELRKHLTSTMDEISPFIDKLWNFGRSNKSGEKS